MTNGFLPASTVEMLRKRAYLPIALRNSSMKKVSL